MSRSVRQTTVDFYGLKRRAGFKTPIFSPEMLAEETKVYIYR